MNIISAPKSLNKKRAGFLSIATDHYVVLSGITVFAALLRFYKLGDWSFWGDEVFSVGFKEDGFNYTIWRQSLAQDLIHLVIRLLGTNEWNARLAPALIGIVSVPLLYFPLRRVTESRVALVASGLLAISPWHLYWSQNARFYSLLLLFYSLALLTAQIGFEEDRPWYLVGSLILLGLAARERLFALMFVGVLISYLCLDSPSANSPSPLKR